MRSIRRILVAVKDPAARSSAAVAKAAQLAHALDAELELFHGIATPAYTDALVYSDWNVAEIEHSTRAQYLKQLERVASRLRADAPAGTSRARTKTATSANRNMRARKSSADL